MNALRAERLVVRRGGISAVREASLALPAGRWFGLIGANGSGKTSLLRAIAGRLPIESGAFHLNGRDLTGDRAARAREIGFAPEGAMLPARRRNGPARAGRGHKAAVDSAPGECGIS